MPNNYMRVIWTVGDYLTLFYRKSSPQLEFKGVPTRPTVSEAYLRKNSWMHIAVTYNRQYARIFIDAEEMASKTNTAALYYKQDISLGSNYYSIYGTVGEFRIYNRALTSQEIQHNYLMTKWRYR